MLLVRTILFLAGLCLIHYAQAQSLDDYLIMAAENNPGLKAKYLEYQAALERVPQVGSLPDPTLTFGYFILPVETRVGAQQARFSISQMFPWFGTLSARKDAATLSAKAKYEAFEAAKDLLYYQVKVPYYQLWQLRKEIALMEANLEILNSYESLATTKYETGEVGLVDVIRVQVQIDEAENQLDIMRQKETPLLSQFNALLNRPRDAAVLLLDSLVEVAQIPALDDTMLLNNPRLAQLDWQQRAYAQQLQAAKKAGMPQIGVGLDYAIVQERRDAEVPDNGQDILMPMVSISLPIYRKKYKAMQNEASFQREAVEESKTNLVNLLNVEYAQALWQYQDALSRVKLNKSQIQKSESALNILTTAYSTDNKDFEEVLRMQQQILQFQMQKVRAESELRIAVAKLDHITAN